MPSPVSNTNLLDGPAFIEMLSVWKFKNVKKSIAGDNVFLT